MPVAPIRFLISAAEIPEANEGVDPLVVIAGSLIDNRDFTSDTVMPEVNSGVPALFLIAVALPPSNEVTRASTPFKTVCVAVIAPDMFGNDCWTAFLINLR
jgi:hypothetical protein